MSPRPARPRWVERVGRFGRLSWIPPLLPAALPAPMRHRNSPRPSRPEIGAQPPRSMGSRSNTSSSPESFDSRTAPNQSPGGWVGGTRQFSSRWDRPGTDRERTSLPHPCPLSVLGRADGLSLGTLADCQPSNGLPAAETDALPDCASSDSELAAGSAGDSPLPAAGGCWIVREPCEVPPVALLGRAGLENGRFSLGVAHAEGRCLTCDPGFPKALSTAMEAGSTCSESCA